MCICRLDKNTNFAVIFEDIKKMKDQIETLTSSDQDQETRLDSLTSSDQDQETRLDSLTSSDQDQDTRLDSLATATATGTWCAYQDGPVSGTGTIGYDRLTVSDTNMEVTYTPPTHIVNIYTGKYSHTCY